MLLSMGSPENSQDEIERLKKQAEWERIRAVNLTDRAQYKYESQLAAQKEKSTEVIAILAVLFICAALMILGLTGVLS